MKRKLFAVLLAAALTVGHVSVALATGHRYETIMQYASDRGAQVSAAAGIAGLTWVYQREILHRPTYISAGYAAVAGAWTLLAYEVTIIGPKTGNTVRHWFGGE